MTALPELLIGREYSEENVEWRWGTPVTRKAFDPRDLREGKESKIKPHVGDDLTYSGHNHLLTIAGTGAGKGRSVIIPNLVHYPGPVIVFDPKGENYAVTARRRRELGHQVWKIDPFHRFEEPSDQFNPFDIFHLRRETVEAGAATLAGLLPDYSSRVSLDHHHHLALDLIAGLIAHVAADSDRLPAERSLLAVWDLLSVPAAESRLHVLVSDEQARTSVNKMASGQQARTGVNKMASGQIRAYLDLPENDLRPIVWNTARRLLDCMHVEGVQHSLRGSSFPIQEIVEGKKHSVYIIIPPEKLKRYSALLRLWLGSLMKAMLSRTQPPESKSLFLLDECGKFGAFQILEDAITVGRGYGMQVWTFWQDLSQIKALFPASWQTILANCDVTQFFGPRNQMVSSEFGQVFGAQEDEIRRLRLSDQITVIMGGAPVRSTRFDYLSDDRFKPHCDHNPFYGKFTPVDPTQE